MQSFPVSVLAQDSAITARVFVTSDPPGQSIVLDGRKLDATTPTELDLHPGQYYLIISAPGYQPLTHDLALTAGEQTHLEFILLKTPPEPPTPEELRALSPPIGADDPNSAYWAEAGPREMANESCRECHPAILNLHAQGEHRIMSCEDCHSTLADHVKDNQVIGTMHVVQGEAIQSMCMMCHDKDGRNRPREPARTIRVRRHLQQLNVTAGNRCEDCHHVHDPQKWVHEAREMVGIPEKMAKIPLLDLKAADDKQQQYHSMAEIFFIFPLAPGVLGETAFRGDESFPSKTLLISGLALVAGNYLLGKRARAREINRINRLNDIRRATNEQVTEHNRRVKDAMAAYNEAVTLWSVESDGRGVVTVGGQ